MKTILIKQTNSRIVPDVYMNLVEFIGDEKSKYVLFYYDEKVKRNRYKVKSIKMSTPEECSALTEDNYRGEVEIEGYGKLPLFTIGFNFPLYGVELLYQHTKDNMSWYSVIKSPISFKLKDKEDRLCFDVVTYEYDDLPDVMVDRWTTKKCTKALKVKIDPIYETPKSE